MNWTLRTATTFSVVASVVFTVAAVMALPLSEGTFITASKTGMNTEGGIQMIVKRGAEGNGPTKGGAEGNGAEGNGPKKNGGAEGNGLESKRFVTDNDGAEGNGPARPRRLGMIEESGVIAGMQEIFSAQKSTIKLSDLLKTDSKLFVRESTLSSKILDVYFMYPNHDSVRQIGELVQIQGEVFYSQIDLRNVGSNGQVKLPHTGTAVLSFDESKSDGQASWQMAWSQNMSLVSLDSLRGVGETALLTTIRHLQF